MRKLFDGLKTMHFGVLLAGLALVFGLFGCSDDDEELTTEIQGCTSNEDCHEGQICEEETGDCVDDPAFCAGNEDCDEDEICDPATNTCVLAYIACSGHHECPEGLVCDPLDATCYDDARCIFEGEPCDPEVIQPLAFVCREDGTGTDRCFANCFSTIDCPEGEVCLPVDGDGTETRRSCRAGGECDGLFDTSCGEGRKCVPIWEGVPFGKAGVAGKDVATGEFACIDIAAEPLAEGAACDAYECDAGHICYRTPVHNQCLALPDQWCSVDGAGCAEGEYCYIHSMLAEFGFGICDDHVCDPYAPETGCEEGEQCLISSTLFGPHQPKFGECWPLGTGEIGDSCSQEQHCGEGLICLTNHGCQPACSRAALPDELGACEEGSACAPLSWQGRIVYGAGYCWSVECDPIAGTGCLADEQCLLFTEDHLGYELIGICETSTGEALAGEACEENTDCAMGFCFLGKCRDFCDYAAGDADCPDGLVCEYLFGPGELNPGVCFQPCDPYTGGSDCPEDEKCSVHFDDPTRGLCGLRGIGSQKEGEACERSHDCEGSLLCLRLPEGRCYNVCKLDAESGEAGACSEGQTCYANMSSPEGVLSTTGYCMDVCVVDEPNGCPQGGVCWWNGFFPNPPHEDVCAPGGSTVVSCHAGNVDNLCGPLAICQPPITGFSDDYSCVEFCRAEKGPLHLPGHPDCSQPYAVCDPFDFSPTSAWLTWSPEGYGVCNSNY